MVHCIDDDCFIVAWVVCGSAWIGYVLCFLCQIMSHFVTLSIIEIEVSPFTSALIGPILIYIQAASLLSIGGKVGVSNPMTRVSDRKIDLAMTSSILEKLVIEVIAV